MEDFPVGQHLLLGRVAAQDNPECILRGTKAGVDISLHGLREMPKEVQVAPQDTPPPCAVGATSPGELAPRRQGESTTQDPDSGF